MKNPLEDDSRWTLRGKRFTVDELVAAEKPVTEDIADHLRTPTPFEQAITEFEKLSLPTRMRVAAEVLEEADKRGSIIHWSSQDLRELADRWEREDAERLGREKQVEELAQIIRGHDSRYPMFPEDVASALIDAGWTKVTGDE